MIRSRRGSLIAPPDDTEFTYKKHHHCRKCDCEETIIARPRDNPGYPEPCKCGHGGYYEHEPIKRANLTDQHVNYRAVYGDAALLDALDPKVYEPSSLSKWAEIYPIKPQRFDEDGKPIEEDIHKEPVDSWLPPRLAAVFHTALTWEIQFLDVDDDPEGNLIRSLSEIAKPYALIEEWRLAMLDCARRLQLRLVKGKYFSPNCTGEEMIFHFALENHRGCFDDEDSYPRGEKEYEMLPRSKDDEVFTTLYLTLGF
jgi:hypothetical protein